MANFNDFLQSIENEMHRERMEQIFNWISELYPNLEQVIKWNQPMFLDHGTYIIGFSVTKKHMAIAPEQAGIKYVEEAIQKAGYSYTKELIRIPWAIEVDYSLLEKLITFNIKDKIDCTTFWRK